VRSSQGMSVEQVLALPVIMPLLDAARALGIGKNMAYDLVANNQFPCHTIQVGTYRRVTRAEVLRVLGIQDRPPLADAS
jgi:hypothetical protein